MDDVDKTLSRRTTPRPLTPDLLGSQDVLNIKPRVAKRVLERSSIPFPTQKDCSGVFCHGFFFWRFLVSLGRPLFAREPSMVGQFVGCGAVSVTAATASRSGRIKETRLSCRVRFRSTQTLDASSRSAVLHSDREHGVHLWHACIVEAALQKARIFSPAVTVCHTRRARASLSCSPFILKAIEQPKQLDTRQDATYIKKSCSCRRKKKDTTRFPSGRLVFAVAIREVRTAGGSGRHA